ncbi:MAG TPA: glutamate--tRNA ligase family protein, partial [Tepidisphaeraceae bacterium]|nr:glutamate--tRNA ligase family protein [Tepidisphaeraceae bacterium]
ARGLAYKAYETKEELDAQRAQAERAKRAFIYRRPNLTAEQIADYEKEGRPAVIRFAMPVREYRFDDVVLGKPVVLPANQVQDFIIRKTDGMPTYHFAVVVDDAEMGITHILRGQEHLLNTHNHIALQEALGYPRPIYGHLSIIQNIDGSKMSKRDGDKKIRAAAGQWMRSRQLDPSALAGNADLDAGRVEHWLADEHTQLDFEEQAKVMSAIGMSKADLPEIMVHDFRANGYLPAVLLNFLALLGWSPGGDRERMGISELIERFSIDGIGKSSAKFSRDKLLAFSTEAFTAAEPAISLAAMRDYLSVNSDSSLNSASDAELLKVLAMNAGFHILREVDDKSRFLFLPDDKIAYQPEAVEKVLKKNDGQGFAALRKAREALAKTAEWNAEPLEHAIKELCTVMNLGLGKVAQPIRVAVSGSAISPPIFQSLELLGRDRTLARIDRCLALAS